MRETWPLGRSQLLSLGAAYVVLTAVWSGLGRLLVGPFEDSGIVRTDERIARSLERNRTESWNRATLVGSWLAETVVKIAVTVLIVVVLVRALRRWLEALVVAVPLILEASVFITSTTIVGRSRPDVVHLDESPVGSSFPSGHVAAAVVYSAMAIVAFWLTRNVLARTIAVAGSVLVPLIVGASRMYRGMHFLSDVVAGMVLGAVTVVITTLILVRTPQGRAARAECWRDEAGQERSELTSGAAPIAAPGR